MSFLLVSIIGKRKDTNGNYVNKILNSELAEIAQGIVNETNAKKSYIKIWTN